MQPLYVARRLIRFASEDVGLADPSALVQAVAAFQVRCFVVWGRSNFSKAAHMIGMPECNVILAQCVAYLSRAPKSVAVYKYTLLISHFRLFLCQSLPSSSRLYT